MMSALNVARVAKLIALLGFFLPWLLVSCAGEPIGRLTGIDLATGGLTTTSHADPNYWVGLSLAAVIAGIIVSFVLRDRAAFVGMAFAAIIALVASAIGVANVSAKVVGDQPGRSQPSNAVGWVDLQYGYVITVAGLVAAIGASGMALSRRERRSVAAG
jgi:hypothetical protein